VSPTTVPGSENPSESALADQARFVAMQARHAAGATQKAIAAEFDLHPRTVQRWLRANGPPPGKHAPRPTKIKSVAPFLRERYTQGCTNANQLYQVGQRLGIHSIQMYEHNALVVIKVTNGKGFQDHSNE